MLFGIRDSTKQAIIFNSKTNKTIKGTALGYCICESLPTSTGLSVRSNKPIPTFKTKANPKSNILLETFIFNTAFSPLLLAAICGMECKELLNDKTLDSFGIGAPYVKIKFRVISRLMSTLFKILAHVKKYFCLVFRFLIYKENIVLSLSPMSLSDWILRTNYLGLER